MWCVVFIHDLLCQYITHTIYCDHGRGRSTCSSQYPGPSVPYHRKPRFQRSRRVRARDANRSSSVRKPEYIPKALGRWNSSQTRFWIGCQLLVGLVQVQASFQVSLQTDPMLRCRGSVVKSKSGCAVVKASHQACARSTDSGKRRQKRPAISSAVSP